MPSLQHDRAGLELNINGLREVFVPYERVTRIQDDIAKLHRRDNGGSEGGVLTLLGDTRSGKTKILRDYKARYPTVVNGRVNAEGDPADLMEVVLLRMPDTTTKNFLERLFSILANLTIKQVAGQGNRRFDIQDNIVALAKTVGLRLILIEETHQGIDRKKTDAAKLLAGVLKDLTNEARFSMVISGTFEAQRLLDASPELSGRILFDHELQPLDWNVTAERMMFLDVLRELDEHLKEFVFGRLSNLTGEAIAKPLLAASLGQIGHAATLLEVAAMNAVDEVLARQCPKMTLEHIAGAFSGSRLRRQNPKLFTHGQGGGGEPADNPVTRLRGRTRQSHKDVAFKG
ncbi:TniB family NTP-binding protein [Acidisphaera sp. L21]|uniref:TniB family NTP-binding protein n=1 Tax=Acidisphaera sp. L21 TaxID=1641851 RepID=UPI00131DEE3F|nr:TniB family NTP-binding protein [Acidisphaera sp. L21]